MRNLSLLVLGLAASCAPSFVANQPRSLLLGQSYDPTAIRDAIGRAVTNRRMTPQQEVPGRMVLSSSPDDASCLHVVTYTDHSFEVDSTSAPEDAAKHRAAPGSIDERCAAKMTDARTTSRSARAACSRASAAARLASTVASKIFH